MNPLLYGLKIGFGIFLFMILGAFMVKGIWQNTQPTIVNDSNLYLNGTGSLTANKWNNLVDKTNLISIPAGMIASFYLSSCPVGRVAADGANGTPDLRGMFIRGLNSFNSGLGVRADGKQDPDGGSRTLGSYQADELKSHSHNFGNGNHFIKDVANGGTAGWAAGSTALGFNNSIANFGGTESRGKNVAMIYCMKQ